MTIKSPEAEELVRRMYGAHGSRPDEKAVTELSVELVRASCSLCARAAIEENHDDGKRPLTVPTFRGAFYARLGSVEHGLHLHQDEREVRAGDAEGFWRDKGLRVIREVLHLDREEGTYVALAAWWAGIPADVGVLREELLEANGKPATWAIGAVMHLQNATDAAAQTEKLRRACRKASTQGIESLTTEELP